MNHSSKPITSDPSPSWVRLTQHVLRTALPIAFGVVGVLAVGWAVAAGLAATREWRVVAAVLHYASVSTLPWLAFTALLICVGAVVRPLVQAGFTRRAVTVAGMLSAVVVGVTLATASTALDRAGIALVEEALGGEAEFLGLAPWWAVLGAMTVVCLTGAVSGVLVGASFVRWGGWATLLLPFTAGLPFLAQDALTSSVTLRDVGGRGSASWSEQVQASLTTAPTVALSMLALALTVAATWLVLRGLPLPPRAAA